MRSPWLLLLVPALAAASAPQEQHYRALEMTTPEGTLVRYRVDDRVLHAAFGDEHVTAGYAIDLRATGWLVGGEAGVAFDTAGAAPVAVLQVAVSVDGIDGATIDRYRLRIDLADMTCVAERVDAGLAVLATVECRNAGW